MSEAFMRTFASASAIGICFVVAIIMIGTYFSFISKMEYKKAHTGVINITGVLDGDTPVNVYLQDGEVINSAKIRQLEIKDYAPSYSFHDMLVLELEQGGFTMLRPERIQRIDLPNCKEIAMTVKVAPPIDTMSNK